MYPAKNVITIVFSFVNMKNIPSHSFSGLTAQSFEGVTTTLEDVHKDLQKIIFQDSILIGHSMSNDLRVLKVLKLLIQ